MPADMALDRTLLRAGVDQANIHALLMCLVQRTGAFGWLDTPFTPQRGRGLDDNDDGGLSEDVQKRIRDAAYDAIKTWAEGAPFKAARPTTGQLARMLSAAMSEPVPEEYGDVI